MERFLALATQLGMEHAILITPDDVCFDIRAFLKCRWGCEDALHPGRHCSDRGTTLAERMEMVRRYRHILLVHSHDARALSKAVLEIERQAFLAGHYFAFAIRACNLCATCLDRQGQACPHSDKVRPCDQLFGIDVYATARRQGLPCDVLLDPNDIQNRYGFVLLD